MNKYQQVNKIRSIFVTLFFILASTSMVFALDENCTVAILNRTAQVTADGTWVLGNVPANFGKVRARATCVENGQTVSGQSDFFEVPSDGSINVTPINLESFSQVPKKLDVSVSQTVLNSIGATSQISILGHYPDNSTANLTSASSGTTYTISNPAIASITADGLVTALLSGKVFISATNDGAVAATTIDVVLNNDSDGDGIGDDLELLSGLNPNDPADGFEDRDGDGLSNKEELVDIGTLFNNPDTDGDGISDGEEVVSGSDGYITNPFLIDSDGDGIDDLTEILAGSNPSVANNLASVLSSISVIPSTFQLRVNSIIGEASAKLNVQGNLSAGGTVDLTSTQFGTNYLSSNLSVCNFGSESGRVFAGANGNCTITVNNNSFSAQATGTVTTFNPSAVSSLTLPGQALNVDVKGNFAYVAAGTAGLQIVDVTNRAAPIVVGSFDTPGNAQDIRVIGNYAFLADGVAGIRVFDIQIPSAPQSLAVLDTPGDAQDLAFSANRLYIADGANGVHIVNIATPASPVLLSTIDTAGDAIGVAVKAESQLLGVASAATGVQFVDISNELNPQVLGSVVTGNARDIAISGNNAYIADLAASMTALDISNPTQPVILDTTPTATGGLLNDIEIRNNFAFGADIFFVNQVPIVSIETPSNLSPLFLLNFTAVSDDNGNGIAVDSSYVYLTAGSRLFIGKYLDQDNAGVAPNISIVEPAASTTVIENSSLLIKAEASDDISVASVEFLLNGQIISTATSLPYETVFQVPTGISGFSLGARAFDLAGNIGNAQNIAVNVIPDPLTTVTGRIVDDLGQVVAGAQVECHGLTTFSAADGQFTIESVPTVQANIRCQAQKVFSTQITYIGSSQNVDPVSAGITNLGDIAIFPASAIWIGPNNGGLWNNPANWNGGFVPGPNDDVVIQRPNANVVVTYTSGNSTINSLRSDEELIINGGSLTIKALSVIDGTISVNSSATLIGSGTAAIINIIGNANLTGANLQALNGATLNLQSVSNLNFAFASCNGSSARILLPIASSIDNSRFSASGGCIISAPSALTYTTSSVGYNLPLLTANGSQTLIDFPAVQVIDDSFGTYNCCSGANWHQINAFNNATINLGAVQTIYAAAGDEYLRVEASTGGQINLASALSMQSGNIRFDASGPASLIDLSSLISLNATTASLSRIQVGLTASVLVPSLTQVNGIEYVYSGSNPISTSQISSFTNGVLTLNGAAPNFNSLTNLAGTVLSVNAASPNFNTVNMLDNARVFASNGAIVSFPNVLNYTASSVGYNLDIFSATGSNTILDLSAIQYFDDSFGTYNCCSGSNWHRIVASTGAQILMSGVQTLQGSAGDEYLRVEALSGGDIILSSLITIPGGNVAFNAQNSGSIIDLSAISQFSASSSSQSSLQAINGGQLLTSNLSTINAVNLIVDNLSSISTSQITSFTNGILNLNTTSPSFQGLTNLNGTLVTVNATSPNFNNVTQINNARFIVSGGAQVSLPAVTSYVTNQVGYNLPLISVIGANSLFTSPITFLDDSFGTYNCCSGNNWHQIIASAGGQINLPALQIIVAAAGDEYLRVEADTGSTINMNALTSVSSGNIRFDASSFGAINVPALASINATSPDLSRLYVSNSGVINNPILSNINGMTLDWSNSGTISTSQIVNFTNGYLFMSVTAPNLGLLSNLAGSAIDINSVTPNLNSVNNFTNARINVSGGVTINLPSVTSYNTSSIPYNYPLITVTGSGTALNFPNLTIIDDRFGTYNCCSGSNWHLIKASNGASLNLGLTSILYGSAGDEYLRIEAENAGTINLSSLASVPSGNLRLDATGPNSTINLSALTTLNTTTRYISRILVNNGGAIINPVLSSINGTSLVLNGNSTSISTSQINTFTNSELNLTGISPLFTNLVNINNSIFNLYAGSNISLPLVTSYSSVGVDYNQTLFNVDGVGSAISLPACFNFDASFGTGACCSGSNWQLIKAINSGSIDFPALIFLYGGVADEYLRVEAISSGNINMHNLTNIPTGSVDFLASGFLSSIDLTSLTAYNSNDVTFTENNAGNILP